MTEELRRGNWRLMLGLAGMVMTLVVATLAGWWFWSGADGSAEQEERNAFCWSLVPGGEPEEGGSTAECGEALETAMTGRPAGTRPPERTPERDAGRVRVFEKVVRAYGDRVQDEPEAVPQEIRRNMANAFNFYSSDIRYVIGLYGDLSSGMLETEPNDVDIERSTVEDFVRGVAEDGESFGGIHRFHLDLARGDVTELSEEDFRKGTVEAELAALKVGESMGFLDAIGAQALEGRSDGGAREGWLESYGRAGEGKAEEIFSEDRDGGYLVKIFQERSNALGTRFPASESRGTGLHPKIIEKITEGCARWV
ncbi:hypothetical protein IQ279_03780 [Streptomyces verrucosisporus]|uniref:hypothetical protein n=1 Tax=Streptomyces verrucosisporus TaxID=1695161 RepID=UPI0019D2CD4D|nr:hypothetical protein [Streptomyces verrucosisporus]MBN3928771.1 hypothetical protein [Streptomyces verrucosisporus]